MSKPDSASIQLRPARGEATRLFILLHGVGADAEGLLPLATMIQRAFPSAVIEIPRGFSPFDSAPFGRQWFSIRGVTEENRPARVAEALPALVHWVRQAQEREAMPAQATILIGFSQGAIMALEAAAAHDDLATRVIAFAGRFATWPQLGPRLTRIHLLHGEDDAVMPVAATRAAFEWLREGGCDISLDTLPGYGHELPPALVEKALERLRDF